MVQFPQVQKNSKTLQGYFAQVWLKMALWEEAEKNMKSLQPEQRRQTKN